MSDLDDFMAQNKPTYRSKLQPYLDDIRVLRQHGYSEPDILRYLLEKKQLSVTRKTLHAFILKNFQAASGGRQKQSEQPNGQAENVPREKRTAAAGSADNSNGSAAPSANQQSKKPPLKKGIKKFDWKNASTEGLI